MEKCDKALTSCDEALKEREKQVVKQKDLIIKQEEQIQELKEKQNEPVRDPIVWASIGSAAVAIGGPVTIPFVVLGVIAIGFLFK